MLNDYNYKLLRQSGSHQIYSCKSAGEVVVPFKKEFPLGTGRNIIKQIAHASDISFADLVKKYGIKF